MKGCPVAAYGFANELSWEVVACAVAASLIVVADDLQDGSPDRTGDNKQMRHY